MAKDGEDHAKEEVSPSSNEPISSGEGNGDDKGNEEGKVKPMCCVYEPDNAAFFLTRRKGKSLSSGGFGIVLPRKAMATASNATIEAEENDSNEKDRDNGSGQDESDGKKKDNTTTSEDYLRLEEALFLMERGVLEVQDEQGKEMEPQPVYELLNSPGAGMALPVYLAYAHLRQQGFRVVRHSSERRAILRDMVAFQDAAETENDDKNGGEDDLNQQAQNNQNRKDEWASLKRSLREVSVQAVPQFVTNGKDMETSLPLAWDAYPPDQTFSRSAPGLPSFSVLVTSYNQGSIPFAQIAQCIQNNDPVPIKVATVSDSGIVVLFGVVSEGVPSMAKAVSS